MGEALKAKAAAGMEDIENDDDAERAARRKSRIDTVQLPKAPTISAEVTSSWLRIFSEGVCRHFFFYSNFASQIKFACF
jgi:hypothetical protein